MNKNQAFQVILQMRDKFVGTKQDQITIDEAINLLNLELFPEPEIKPKVNIKNSTVKDSNIVVDSESK